MLGNGISLTTLCLLFRVNWISLRAKIQFKNESEALKILSPLKYTNCFVHFNGNFLSIGDYRKWGRVLEVFKALWCKINAFILSFEFL